MRCAFAEQLMRLRRQYMRRDTHVHALYAKLCTMRSPISLALSLWRTEIVSIYI